MPLIVLDSVNPLETTGRISFDLTAARGVILRKWWIVPITMLLGLSLMFWQESDLQTSPRYFTLSRTYEPFDETSPLSIVDIDPALINPFPSEENQLAILLNENSRKQALANINGNVEIRVKRSEPNFSLTSTAGSDGKNRFSFVSYGSSSYSFSCSETDERNCSAAIDGYVGQLVAIRTEATKSGLQRSIKLIDLLLTSDTVISSISVEKLTLQRAALEMSIELATGELQLIDETKYFGGEQITTVNRTTYLFGLLVGFIIGCLILLQLVVSDGKIRSARKLIGIVGYNKFLGSVLAVDNAISLQHLASAIRGSTEISDLTTLRLIPIGLQKTSPTIAADLQAVLGCKIFVTNPIESLSAEALTPSANSPIIFLVARHHSQVSQLEYAWTVVEKSSNMILGAVLIG